MQYHKYIAEALGTCVLTLIVALSVAGVFPVSTAVLAAVTLGLFVYTLGHVSGTHLNPAVTLGLLSIGKIHAKDAGGYIASQVIGALVAMLIARMFVPLAGLQGIQSQAVHIGLGELIGAFVFGFGIAAVVYDRAVKEFSDRFTYYFRYRRCRKITRCWRHAFPFKRLTSTRALPVCLYF
jgi:glycerol uptake facilitator-like aquaporin